MPNDAMYNGEHEWHALISGGPTLDSCRKCGLFRLKTVREKE